MPDVVERRRRRHGIVPFFRPSYQMPRVRGFRRPHCRPCCGGVCEAPRQPARPIRIVHAPATDFTACPVCTRSCSGGARPSGRSGVSDRFAHRTGGAGGFTPSKPVRGFENPFASALITVAELPADAYADVEKGFSNDELLKSRGWTIKVREPLTFKDGKGFFIAGPQESQGQKRYEAVMVANTGGITSLVSVQMAAESMPRSRMRSCATCSRL